MGVLTWEMVAIAIVTLTIVRMLPVAASLIRTDLSPHPVVFRGWFGQHGLASIILALLVIIEEPLLPGGLAIVDHDGTVLMSLYSHGVTTAPLSGRYARRTDGMREETREFVYVPDLPTRREKPRNRPHDDRVTQSAAPASPTSGRTRSSA